MRRPVSVVAPQAADGGPVEDTFEAFEDRYFNLITFGQAPPTAPDLGLSDVVRIWSIPSDRENDAELARVGIPQPSFYLIRPDGHVGLSGKIVDAPAILRTSRRRSVLRQAWPGTTDADRDIMRPEGN